MVIDCDECARLWDELAFTTTEAIRIDNKLKIAALQRDYESVSTLTLVAETAFAARDRAREMKRRRRRGDTSTVRPSDYDPLNLFERYLVIRPVVELVYGIRDPLA